MAHSRIACEQPTGMNTGRPVGIIHQDWLVDTVVAPVTA
jgi:hypothetical protein